MLAETIVKDVTGVVPPIALARVMLPVPAVKVMENAPLTVPFKVMFPAPGPVLSDIFPKSVIALENVMG